MVTSVQRVEMMMMKVLSFCTESDYSDRPAVDLLQRKRDQRLLRNIKARQIHTDERAARVPEQSEMAQATRE